MPTLSLPQAVLIASSVLPLLVSAAPAVARYGTERVASVVQPQLLKDLRAGILPAPGAVQSALSEFSGRLVQGQARNGESFLSTVVPSSEGWQRARVETTILTRDGAPSRIESFDIPDGPRVPDSGSIRAAEGGGVTVVREYRGSGPNGADRPSSLVPNRHVVISETYSVGDASVADGLRITQSVRARESIMHRTRVEYSLERSPDGKSVMFDRQMSLDPVLGGAAYPGRGRVREALPLELGSGAQVVGMSIVPNASGATLRVQTVSRSGQGMEHEFTVPRVGEKPSLVRSRAHAFDARRSVEPIAANRAVEPGSEGGYRGLRGVELDQAADGALQ